VAAAGLQPPSGEALLRCRVQEPVRDMTLLDLHTPPVKDLRMCVHCVVAVAARCAYATAMARTVLQLLPAASGSARSAGAAVAPDVWLAATAGPAARRCAHA
jgi:hypothetical protein